MIGCCLMVGSFDIADELQMVGVVWTTYEIQGITYINVGQSFNCGPCDRQHGNGIFNLNG